MDRNSIVSGVVVAIIAIVLIVLIILEIEFILNLLIVYSQIAKII